MTDAMREPDRQRRALLGAAAAFGAGSLIGCADREPALPAGGFAGPDPVRGHRLREFRSASRIPDQQRRTGVVIVGSGIAGLAAARALAEAGIDDYHLLELEAEIGGNSRAGMVGGMACPWGAHYLPVPNAGHDDLEALLDELGLRQQIAGATVWNERHLAHAPHERLWRPDLGRWQDGLLPVDGIGDATLAQYRRFAAAVAREADGGRYRIPTRRAVWDDRHTALDSESFAVWLNRHGFDAAPLRWYLDYCCRDDYGAGLERVSAWAGLHYFASRHGFHAPDDDAPEEPVLTWPEGNAWLVERLARPHRERISTEAMTVRIAERRDGVEIDVVDGRSGRQLRWQAERVIVAVPLMIAVRLVDSPPDALRRAAAELDYAPWLVANLHLDRALDARRDGPPLCWDNVVYGSRGLGYVNAGNQLLRGHDGPTVLTVYRAFGDDPASGRGALLSRPWQHWAEALLAELAPMHPDLRSKCMELRIARYGHAMAIPAPGVRGSRWLTALTEPTGRIAYAHADLSGHSVFEEAWHHGLRAGRQTANALHG